MANVIDTLQDGDGNNIYPRTVAIAVGESANKKFVTSDEKSKLANATDTATPETLILRDASGRAKVVAPVDDADIARKDTVTMALAEMSQKVREIHISHFAPLSTDGAETDLWFKLTDTAPATDYFFRFDASKLVLANAAKVTSWEDLSANNIDLAQATEDNQPVYLSAGLNSRPTVKFAGAEFLDNVALTLDHVDANTFFVVCNFDSLVGAQEVFTIGAAAAVTDATSKTYSIRKSSSTGLFSRINYATESAVDYTLSGDDPMLVACTYDKINNTLYVNSTLIEQAAYTTDIGAHDALRIGKSLRSDLTSYFIGCISEVIYYTRALTTLEMTKMQAYLTDKWGIV